MAEPIPEDEVEPKEEAPGADVIDLVTKMKRRQPGWRHARPGEIERQWEPGNS